MDPQMNITAEEWELIETYLDLKDNSEKSILWKEKIAQIPNAEGKLEHVKNVSEEIEDSIKKSKIKEFHNQVSIAEIDSKGNDLTTKKSKPKTIWYSIAAVFVILFGIFWMMDISNTSEKIFAQNFKPDIGLPLKMGAKNEYKFYEGMLDYKQGNYEDAIEKWQVLLKDNSENDTLNYFLGVAHLAQGNSAESLKYLENQDRFQKGIFKEDAAYYTALAKIKEGKFKDAKTLLEKNPSEKNISLLKSLPK